MEEMKGNYDERVDGRRGVKYPLFGFVVTILVLLSSMSMVSGSSQCAQAYMVRGDNITITNPTEGAVILHNSTVTITWEYTGDSHVDYYEVYIDDDGNPHYLENNITVTLQDGKHWFGVVAYNGTGEIARRIGSAEVNFTVDTEPPVLVIRDPWEGEIIAESSVMVDWDNGTFQSPQYDGIPTDHYEVKLDNSSWINVGLQTSYNFTNMKDGKHTIYVREYDIYGLNTTNMVNFTVDAHPPILTILSPEQNSFVNKSAVMVKWEAHDGNDIDHYQIAVDYGPANDEWLYLSNQTNFYVFTNLTEGTHTVYVEAYESAPPIQPDAPGPQPKGDYSLKTVSFTVDITPPTLRINPPTYLNLSSVRINWVGDDNIGLSHYEIKMDNSSWVNVGLNTSYTFTGVHGRNHIVYVRAYDLANNMVEKELSLTPPSFNFYALNSTKGMVGWEHITLEIKEYRGMELTKMRIVIVNATSGNNTPIVDTGWLNYTEYYNITLNKTGEYEITVSVKDTANNMATVSHELYVALSPPVIKQVWLNQNLTTNRTNATIHAEDPAGGLMFGYSVDGVFIGWYNSSTIPIYLPYKSGNYSITLYVKDRFGHETTQSTWVFVNLTANKEGNGGTTNGGNQNSNPSGVAGIPWDILTGLILLLGVVIIAVVWLLSKRKPKEHGEKELTRKEKAILKELTAYIDDNQGAPRVDVLKAVSTRMGVSEGEVATMLDYGIENFLFEEREEEGVKRVYPISEIEEESEEETPEGEDEEGIKEKIPEGMVKCPVCGALNPEDAVTCSTCGAPLHEEKEEEKKEEEDKDDLEAIE